MNTSDPLTNPLRDVLELEEFLHAFIGALTKRHLKPGEDVTPLVGELGLKPPAALNGIVSAAADQGRRHRARQQDRQNGLGDDGQGRALQRTRRACGVNQIALDIRHDVKVGRANST